MRFIIGVADRLYEFDLSNLKDSDNFLDYYHTHELFPVIMSDEYKSITYIPKHAITAIHIIDEKGE